MTPAPKGNQNALKHGLYARHFKPAETAELRRMAWNNLLYEIMGSRAIAEKALNLVNQHMQASKPDTDKVVALIHAWSDSVATIGLLATRHALLNGKSLDLNDALTEALAGLPPFAEDDESVPP